MRVPGRFRPTLMSFCSRPTAALALLGRRVIEDAISGRARFEDEV
ncbi:MAG: hypothetical protein ABWX57_07765 [Aeromicrobium sp.]